MKILIACEYSGRVREAFRAKGHKVFSADFEPAEDNSPWHHQGDVFDILYSENWDLMIAHPPCTYLTVSANKWFKDQPPRKSGALVGEERRKARVEAQAFFMQLMNAPIPNIAIENPIGVMSTYYRKPDQVLQPWMFGHGETKATCLWLKNLPILTPTNIVEGREQIMHTKKGKPKGEPGWKFRSRTYQGIANAMADQWG
jgi:hypothetical protein